MPKHVSWRIACLPPDNCSQPAAQEVDLYCYFVAKRSPYLNHIFKLPYHYRKLVLAMDPVTAAGIGLSITSLLLQVFAGCLKGTFSVRLEGYSDPQ